MKEERKKQRNGRLHREGKRTEEMKKRGGKRKEREERERREYRAYTTRIKTIWLWGGRASE